MKTKHLIVVAMFLLAATLSASTFVAMDSMELIEKSDRIVQGEVIALTSFWDEAGRIIVTEATIRVVDNIVGEATDSVVRVRTPGGRVGPLRVEAAGFPRFRKGQEVVLFLQIEEGMDYQRIVGFQQGHFEVVQRDDGVTLAVPQIDGGARFFHRDGRRMAAPQSMELGQFKSVVRDAGRALNRPVR